ncbi:major capsid protein [Clostridium sp. Cult1]|uniref:major capsid protein n=1 Tax=Clostridium sp. Cult1 TaxID=2079002 RepID=UPI001F1B286B|nr:major capsid protein [Clostridium sp. Cult1]MCF6464196.1 coat protein [Clostridium sp. Cult1]
MTTRIADVIQPEVFTPYVIQRTMELSALINSGIVEHNAEFDALAGGPNTTVNMPYWNDLTGDSEVMKDDGALTPGKIGSNKDVAVKHGRARAWGANGLSALLSGDDPMGAIADLVAAYWARDMQKILLATLDGVFASDSMVDKVLDISGELDDAALLTPESFVDANQLMGDAKDLLTGVMMHSAIEAYLAKMQLIEYEETKDKNIRIPYFMNKRVIVDDGMPFDTATKTGTMYLFGNGAIALGNGSHPRIIETETDRDTLSSSGEDFLINRKIFILHPRGIKWTDTSKADVFPTNAEIGTGTNWERVYEPKAIRVVKFKFKIA